MELVIITGLSGAGKTAALNILEDSGYQCIDNLPLPLIRDLVKLMENTPEVDKVALALDQRGRVFKTELYDTIKDLKEEYNAKVLFLNAQDEVLIKRFKEKRRSHPLSRKGNITDGIRNERKLMSKVMSLSIIVDTTNLNLGALKNVISSLVLEQSSDLAIVFTTFGFKNGISMDADLVFDVRFITNPYYIPDLKYKSGYEEDVYKFVMGKDETRGFVDRVYDLLKYLIPLYRNEGKEQLAVAFGCTGGRQRSVSVARYLKKKFEEEGHVITLINRDLEVENEI